MLAILFLTLLLAFYAQYSHADGVKVEHIVTASVESGQLMTCGNISTTDLETSNVQVLPVHSPSTAPRNAEARSAWKFSDNGRLSMRFTIPADVQQVNLTLFAQATGPQGKIEAWTELGGRRAESRSIVLDEDQGFETIEQILVLPAITSTTDRKLVIVVAASGTSFDLERAQVTYEAAVPQIVDARSRRVWLSSHPRPFYGRPQTPFLLRWKFTGDDSAIKKFTIEYKSESAAWRGLPGAIGLTAGYQHDRSEIDGEGNALVFLPGDSVQPACLRLVESDAIDKGSSLSRLHLGMKSPAVTIPGILSKRHEWSAHHQVIGGFATMQQLTPFDASDGMARFLLHRRGLDRNTLVSFSADGFVRRLLYVTDEVIVGAGWSDLFVFDTRTGKQLARWYIHDPIGITSFTTNGKIVLSVSSNGMIRIWKIAEVAEAVKGNEVIRPISSVGLPEGLSVFGECRFSQGRQSAYMKGSQNGKSVVVRIDLSNPRSPWVTTTSWKALWGGADACLFLDGQTEIRRSCHPDGDWEELRLVWDSLNDPAPAVYSYRIDARIREFAGPETFTVVRRNLLVAVDDAKNEVVAFPSATLSGLDVWNELMKQKAVSNVRVYPINEDSFCIYGQLNAEQTLTGIIQLYAD